MSRGKQVLYWDSSVFCSFFTPLAASKQSGRKGGRPKKEKTK